MSAHPADRAVEALARRQHGAFHHRQALARGATRRTIERRLATGAWVALDRRVSALAGNPPTWLRQAKAAELSVPGSALSGRSAAALHGLDGVRQGAVEVSVRRGGGRRSRLARVRHRDGLPTTTVAGIRVVTVEQALCDLAGASTPAALERALDDALARRLTDVDRVAAAHARMAERRARGSHALGLLVAERGAGYVPPANELEAALRRLLDHPAIPPALHQSPLPWRPGVLQRVDALVPAWRRIVEVDGRRWHTRHADFEHDRRRDQAAQAHGYEVTRFTYRQLVPDHAEALAVLLAIAARHQAGGGR